MFKHMFSVFKQYYTYTFSPMCISKKTENCCLNTYTKQVLSILTHKGREEDFKKKTYSDIYLK